MTRLTSLAALLLTAAASAQPGPAQLRMDTGTFRYSADESMAEVYLSVGAASLTYTRAGSGAFEASLPVMLTIRPTTAAAPSGAQRAAAFERTIDFQVSVPDTSALEDGQVITEQVRAALPPGEYEVEANVRSSAVSVAVGARADLAVPDYAAGTSSMSSIQLARRIVRSQSDADEFVKSGLVVQPYPDAFFGGDLRRVTYYAEVYNVPPDPAGYTLLAYLSDSSRPTPLAGTESRTTRSVQPVDVVLGAIEVGELPTGEYTLHLAALNGANEAVAEQSKRLFVINPDVAQPTRNVAIAEDDEILYSAMGEEELMLNLDHAKVVGNSREIQQIGGLSTDEERRNFLVRFWRDREAASGTNARRDFYARLAFVNDNYPPRRPAGLQVGPRPGVPQVRPAVGGRQAVVQRRLVAVRAVDLRQHRRRGALDVHLRGPLQLGRHGAGPLDRDGRDLTAGLAAGDPQPIASRDA